MRHAPPAPVRAVAWSALALAAGATLVAQDQRDGGFRFRSGVELINVTATVTDQAGRFVRGLTQQDFVLFEDGREREITHFSAERVPVSLGIVIDTSGSMAGEKWDAARRALDRFLFDLLDAEDEVFVYRFGEFPDLVQDWTTDRPRVSRALGRITPRGGTALYDAVAEAVPMAQSGHHRRKAVVVISDGNDTSSSVGPTELRRLVRETEVIVYAIGIDGRSETTWTNRPPRFPVPGPGPMPWPFPGTGRRRPPPSYPPWGGGNGGTQARRGDERVNVSALREITDESGGRTEVVRDAGDLDPATASVADELSQQYYLAYPADAPKDGRWHSIRVETRTAAGHRVRHRRGYVATP